MEKYAYNSYGQAVSSELSGGAERVDVTYTGSSNKISSATLVNALGKSTSYTFTEVGPRNLRRVTAVDGHESVNCEAASRHTTYDDNGLIVSKTDWKGTTTAYIRDGFGREIKRIEAAETAEERVIITEWHPEFNVPAKVTTPESVTDYSYDSSGRLLGKKVAPVVSP